MVANQGDTALLNDPVAQQLLNSRIPARLAYSWHDGTPRVIPIWFHWNGTEIVIAGPPDAPKVDVIREHPDVAVTIDDATAWPYKALLIRGKAIVEIIDGVAPEYASSANRYLGEEQGGAWVQMVGQLVSEMGRIRIQPTWVSILDFETRFPSKIAERMSA